MASGLIQPLMLDPAPPENRRVSELIYIEVSSARNGSSVYVFDHVPTLSQVLKRAGYAKSTTLEGRLVFDGLRVVIASGKNRRQPVRLTRMSASTSLALGRKMDLNLADHKGLVLLPGVGPVIADRIINSRKKHGPFSSLNDLMKVKGIGPKTVKKIKPFITVGKDSTRTLSGS